MRQSAQTKDHLRRKFATRTEWEQIFRKIYFRSQKNTVFVVGTSIWTTYCTAKFLLSTTDEDVKDLKQQLPEVKQCASELDETVSELKDRLDHSEENVKEMEKKLLELADGFSRSEKKIENLTCFLKKASTPPTILSRFISSPPVSAPRIPPEEVSSLIAMRQYRG